MTKEELRDKYNLEIEKLSVRAKHILEDQGLLLFDFFYDNYIINQARIEFIRCRNCGVKTQSELNQFVTEMCKYGDNETPVFKLIISRPQLLRNNPFYPIKTSLKSKLLFESGFNRLSVRARNILSSIQANRIDSFYHNAYFKDAQSFLMIRNCGVDTIQEIQSFKVIFKDILDNDQKLLIKDNSFSDIEYFINHTDFFRPIELELFQYYYGFIICDKSETLAEVANRNNYSKERVRQLSKLLIKRIRKLVLILLKQYDLDFHQYFLNEYFLIDQKFADKINSLENTCYSHKFIAIILIYVHDPDFAYLEFQKENLTQNVLFYKATIPFDPIRCYKYLTEKLSLKKSYSAEIAIDDIIKSFSRTDQLESNKRMGIINIITLLISLLNTQEDQIRLENNLIIIRENTKKLKHELLREILDEYKKPMHFLDLYQECLTRGYNIKSPASVHSTMIRYNDIFGLKGPGIYGLLEWGGYFGTIGDVAATILEKRNAPITRYELEDILCRELYISKDSIHVVLFGYEMETRFIKSKNDTISLKKWIK